MEKNKKVKGAKLNVAKGEIDLGFRPKGRLASCMPARRLAQILLFCLFLLRLLGYERLVGFTLSCIAYTLPTKEKGMAGPMGLATPVSFEAL